jgi:hypothetical protein
LLLMNEIAFERCDGCEHMQDETAARRTGVDGLAQRPETNAHGLDRIDLRVEISQRSA